MFWINISHHATAAVACSSARLTLLTIHPFLTEDDDDDDDDEKAEMAKVSQPELKRFLDKRISVNIQGGRKVQGVLRGFDIFLNLVVDDASEVLEANKHERCGLVVSCAAG